MVKLRIFPVQNRRRCSETTTSMTNNLSKLLVALFYVSSDRLLLM